MSDSSQSAITVEGGYIICKSEDEISMVRIDLIKKITYEESKGDVVFYSSFLRDNNYFYFPCTKEQFNTLKEDIIKNG